MALLEKQLFVKKSTLPDAGKGLFTKKFIPKGTRIVEYKGNVRTWKEVQADESENPYIYYVKRNFVIDALNDKSALARYANDAQGLKRVKDIRNNTEYVENGNRVFIEASKDIPANSELFVAYGPEYWQVIRYNNRIDEKENKRKLREKATKEKAKGKAAKVNGKLNGKAVRNGKATTAKVAGKKVKATTTKRRATSKKAA